MNENWGKRGREKWVKRKGTNEALMETTKPVREGIGSKLDLEPKNNFIKRRQ
jgi:hypothetical protein